jgi:hypothetical protein
MPEDQVIEEEISEQESDPDAEAGFDEFAEDEKEPEGELSEQKPLPLDEKPADKAEDDKESDEESEDKPDEEKPDEDKEDKSEETELTAKEAIDKRIEELGEAEDKKQEEVQTEEKPDGDKEKAPPASQEQPPVSRRLTKEQLAQHMNVITDEDLPEGEVIIGDDTFNFEELKEDDPATFNAIKVMSSIAGAKYFNAAIQSGKLVTAEVADGLKKQMEQVIDLVHFSSDMASKGHGDFLTVEGESEGVKTLATSPDIEDSIRVLNYYKETVAETKTSEHDKAAAAKIERKNKLLKGKKTTKPAGPGKKTDENDDEAAFNEFAE